MRPHVRDVYRSLAEQAGAGSQRPNTWYASPRARHGSPRNMPLRVAFQPSLVTAHSNPTPALQVPVKTAPPAVMAIAPAKADVASMTRFFPHEEAALYRTSAPKVRAPNASSSNDTLDALVQDK